MKHSRLPSRQIHLDFHTSPYIPDVGKDFNAGAFAETMAKAHVNSVTCFAKCHHGQCYFPTKVGVSHPAIGERDLLGEQIEALHRRGIRAPIYTTVVWEEDVAQKHPEWRQMAENGSFAEDSVGPDGLPGHLGMWKFNNFLNPDYQNYFGFLAVFSGSQVSLDQVAGLKEAKCHSPGPAKRSAGAALGTGDKKTTTRAPTGRHVFR
jgi:hypothetical protein